MYMNSGHCRPSVRFRTTSVACIQHINLTTASVSLICIRFRHGHFTSSWFDAIRATQFQPPTKVKCHNITRVKQRRLRVNIRCVGWLIHGTMTSPDIENTSVAAEVYQTVVRQVSFTLLMTGRCNGNPAQYERNRRFRHLVHVLG